MHGDDFGNAGINGGMSLGTHLGHQGSLGDLYGALKPVKSGLVGHQTSDLVVHFPSLLRRNRVLGYPEGIGGAGKLGIFLESLDPVALQF